MRRPRFTFGSAPAVWQVQYPPALWTERRGTVGGSGRAASGVLAGYVVREDHLLRLPLRILAAELGQLHALLAWAETGGAFLFEPDPEARPDVVLIVTLESPKAGEEVEPTPDPGYPKVLLQELVLRRDDGAAFLLDYFAPADWPAES